jgi:hypothetical protein
LASGPTRKLTPTDPGFADIKIGDTGTMAATEQLPSGTLLACSATMTGP